MYENKSILASIFFFSVNFQTSEIDKNKAKQCPVENMTVSNWDAKSS